MSDINKTIDGVYEKGLNHSSDQTFAIFSGVLVIYSLSYYKESPELVIVSFLTLIYALIAHKLTTLRKHEELGNYAVGNYDFQIILFTIIYHLYFAWWATSVTAILLSNNKFFQDRLCILFTSFCNSVDLLTISFTVLVVNLILTLIWLIRLFVLKFYENTKWKENKPGNDYYETRLSCKNCNVEEKKVYIRKGVKFENWRCPECKTKSLYLDKKTKNDLEIKIDIN